jgi:hypothetical protein
MRDEGMKSGGQILPSDIFLRENDHLDEQIFMLMR